MADIKEGAALDIAADIERAKISKQFQDGMRELRMETGMTFAELSAASGVHSHNLMKYEQGVQAPQVKYTLPYLLAAAGFTMEITFKRVRKVQVRSREKLQEMIDARTVKPVPKVPKPRKPDAKPDAKPVDKKKEAEAQKKRREVAANKKKLEAKRKSLI